MTDTEINLIITNLCGGGKPSQETKRQKRSAEELRWRAMLGLPDYCNDLNAMFEADAYVSANVMNADQWEQYGKELHKIHPNAVLLKSAADLSSDPIDWYDFAKFVTGLTARQRAEALLKTLSLWKEKGMAAPKAF